MIHTLLGGITPEHFLAEYWQKKPLLIRNAIPGFNGLLDANAAKQLACEEELEARLVRHDAREGWRLQNGPLRKRDFPRSGPWTVLLQGLNLLRDDADALLRRFDFLPFARLDDLMLSYATDGGGVGPHFDSYDVFLLQGQGKRRWRIGAQTDLELIENAPLKILKNFAPSEEWVLESGDMLYLPPCYAHEGVAIGECMTYSIGFRAPSAKELVTEFLYFLEENLNPNGMYADPDLSLSAHAAAIPESMIERVSGMLNQIRWSREDVSEFIGRYLSEPKPSVIFDGCDEDLGDAAFKRIASKNGIRLDRRSQLLYHSEKFFMNGESLVRAEDAEFLRQLADKRMVLPGKHLSASTWTLLKQWFDDGFIKCNPPTQ